MSADEAILSLREAIEGFAAEHAPELVQEARTVALEKARAMLAEAMTEALLAHSATAIQPKVPRTRREPASRRPATKRRDRRAPADEAPSDTSFGCYVYGVVHTPAEVPSDLPGVDSRFPVGPIAEAGLAAIVSRVSLDEFGEERLHENLNDVEWLEQKARAHEEVLDVALHRATVVPMRLCTIYNDEEQVRAMLSREHDLLVDALERLEGKAEWGVKAVAEAHALSNAAAERDGAAVDEEAEPRGTAYMNRKRREARARDEEGELADEWALALHERLEAAACEALLNPLQRPEVSGYDGDMILNGVYLVDDHDVDEFRTLAERLAAEYDELGVTVELTGPWPPYNFVKNSIEAAR